MIADMYEFIDNDPDFDRNSFVPSELHAPEDSAQLRELVYPLHRVYRVNPPLWEIITDVSLGLFDGYRTADETARIIQNRVSIYLSELQWQIILSSDLWTHVEHPELVRYC